MAKDWRRIPGPGIGLVGLILLFAVGCMDPNDLMQGWIGRDGSELVRVWGQPSEEVKGENAVRTIIYTSYWMDGPRATHTCRRSFTTDARDIIRSLSTSGC
jgi:hypothetical protein